jgi:hypothetical protein
MSIGWPQTFGLNLDQVRRLLAAYGEKPRLRVADAALELGLGGPKIEGLNSWLKYLGLRDPTGGQLTPLGQLLLHADPDLVDRTTLWVLHYNLVTNSEATVWFEAINHFLPGRDFFTAEDLRAYFDRPQFEGSSPKQLKSDRGLFLSTYAGTERRALQAIGLLQRSDSGYAVHSIREVPALALGYCLYERRACYGNETTTEMRRLLNEEGSPGVVFRMTEDALRRCLAELESVGLLMVARVADIDGVSYATHISPLNLLQRYYEAR